jgi:hypothetical protein
MDDDVGIPALRRRGGSTAVEPGRLFLCSPIGGSVIPAREPESRNCFFWIPAFTGMTKN